MSRLPPQCDSCATETSPAPVATHFCIDCEKSLCPTCSQKLHTLIPHHRRVQLPVDSHLFLPDLLKHFRRAGVYTDVIVEYLPKFLDRLARFCSDWPDLLRCNPEDFPEIPPKTASQLTATFPEFLRLHREAPISCAHCKTVYPRPLMDEHILKSCPSVPVDCTLGCGTKGLVRGTVAAHVEKDCPKAIVTCTYAVYGCPCGKLERRLMANHLVEAMQDHLSLVTRHCQADSGQLCDEKTRLRSKNCSARASP